MEVHVGWLYTLIIEVNKNLKEEKEMRNIVLLCNMGMSTSLMVSKMKEAAKKDGYECEINAYALQSAEDVMDKADIILIGPQISYELKGLKETFPNKVIEEIQMADYGRMNGEKVLKHVKEVLGD